MKKRILSIFVLFIAGGMLVTTGCRKANGNKLDYMFDKFANKLDLNEEQSEWLAGFRIEIHDEINQVKHERDTMRENLKNSFIAGVLTEEKVNEAISNRSSLIFEKTPVVVDKISEIHANLNPEQRTGLVNILKEFHAKKEKWKKGCRFFKEDKPVKEKFFGRIMEKLQDELVFSDEQTEWLEGFASEIIEDSEILDLKLQARLAKKQVFEKVTDEFVKETFDTEMMTQFIKTNLPFETVKELPIASKVVEFQNNLTAEQRVKLVEVVNKHKEKRKGGFFKRHCFIK